MHAIRGRVRRLPKYLKMRPNASRVCSNLFGHVSKYVYRSGVAERDTRLRRGAQLRHAICDFQPYQAATVC